MDNHLLNRTFQNTVYVVYSCNPVNLAALLAALKYILIGQPITMHIVANYINIHTTIFILHYLTIFQSFYHHYFM